MKADTILEQLSKGDIKALSKCLSLVENKTTTGNQILRQLKINHQIPVIGITGPPGAGKSTLIAGLLKELLKEQSRIGIIVIDPTSPFSHGALLGDRVRLTDYFTDEHVFIRSVATRGQLGGLSARTIEMLDVMRMARFDYIIIETVGVGQSEVEIAALADTTVLVLVPEAGDEIQAMKSGIMEIADIFVVNKSDRPGAGHFAKSLRSIIKGDLDATWDPPVLQTTATKEKGISELKDSILVHNEHAKQESAEKYIRLLSEKVFRLLQDRRMADVSKEELFQSIKSKHEDGSDINIYQIADSLTS